MPLISDLVRESLINQLSAEKYNANLYLSMASFLMEKGFDNLGEIFIKQHDEEEKHARFIFKLLTDLNISFNVPQIPECTVLFTSMIDIGQLFLEREIITTESLKEIRIQASEEENTACPVVEVAMLELLKEQQSELQEAMSFNDKCQIVGSDWKYVLIWDSSLGD